MAIFAALMLCVIIVFLPETLRSIVGNGSIPPTARHQTVFAIISKPSKLFDDDIQYGTLDKTPELNIFATIRLIAHKDTFCSLLYYALFFTSYAMIQVNCQQ
jgi:hypothetical protein